MTAVTQAAEQLGWVVTPGEVVELTPAGTEFMSGDAAERWQYRSAYRAIRCSRVLAMLREGVGTAEGGMLSDEEVLADLTIHSRSSRRFAVRAGRWGGTPDYWITMSRRASSRCRA
jgi:hypothetical protein